MNIYMSENILFLLGVHDWVHPGTSACPTSFPASSMRSVPEQLGYSIFFFVIVYYFIVKLITLFL